MHKLTTAEPDEGRVTVSGEPWIPQLFPPVSSPMVSTSIAADSAAVVGSGTVRTMGVAAGCPLESVMIPTEISNGTITNGTGFESAPFRSELRRCFRLGNRQNNGRSRRLPVRKRNDPHRDIERNNHERHGIRERPI